MSLCLCVVVCSGMKSLFAIDGRAVGIGQPCYVIAEAGVNHNCGGW